MPSSFIHPEETSVALENAGSVQPMAQARVEASAPAHSSWMFWVLSVIAVVPLWTVPYPVVTDYPNHLARWFVLFHMKDPGYHFANFYAPAWGPLPYITPDVLAMALQYILPIDIVGRCILSLCILLVAAATYFFLKRACPENIGLASFGILLAFNPNFLMGSISNEFSLAFCLLTVGLWVSYCQVPRVATAVGVAAGLLLIYLSHLSGFMVAGLVMGIYALFQERRWKNLAVLAVLSLPPFLILASSPSPAGKGATLQYGDHVVWEKLKHLAFPFRLYTSATLDIVVLAALAVLVFLALKKKSAITLQPIWLAVGAVLLLAYFAAPGSYGFGGYVDTRFLPFIFLFLLAAFRFQRLPRSVYIGLALLVLFRVATVEQMFLSRQPELRQLTASFETIPRDARVLPLVSWPKFGLVGAGQMHHMEYGVIQRGFLDPELFHLPGVQPIRLVGSPYCADVFCNAAGASEVDWQQVAGSYDYLWAAHTDPKVIPFASRIADAISSNSAVTVYRVRHPQQ